LGIGRVSKENQTKRKKRRKVKIRILIQIFFSGGRCDEKMLEVLRREEILNSVLIHMFVV
jgi:hypothetical protein